MSYKIPALTRSEVTNEARRNPRPEDCEQCQPGFPVPHWPSPVGCRSSYRPDGDGVERVSRIHCTCDYCF